MLDFIVIVRMRWYLVQLVAVRKGKQKASLLLKTQIRSAKESACTSRVAFIERGLPLLGILLSAGIISKFRFGILIVV